MIFYQQETLVGLCMASIPAIIALYYYFGLHKSKTALLLLGFSGFLMRFLAISLDAYLQHWDERYHALVAKNMMQMPFTPMLRINPVLHYDYTDWCCNHIWVHKQPLFMWQMALSMKIFGVNEVAMRLPSALLGTLVIFLIYPIAEFWTKQKTVAFIASFLYTFSYYQLELTSGRFSLDHNDLIFTCYVTLSIWAFTRYLKHDFSLKWAIVIGFFVGCAVLNKWLTGFMVFGAWGMYVIFAKNEISFLKKVLHIVLSFVVACIVFVPWQLYILNTFPKESAWEFEFNRKHIFEVLQGHKGSFFYHLECLDILYGWFLLPFLVIGIIVAFRKSDMNKVFSFAILSVVVVVYAFFSILVKTKMPSFVYPVCAPIIIIIALGLHRSFGWLDQRFSKSDSSAYVLKLIKISLLFLFGFLSLKPQLIVKHRHKDNDNRNIEIHNTQIFKHLDVDVEKKYVVLNTKVLENVEMMFYKNVNAYDLFPNAEVLDSLQQKGIKFAAYKSHTNQQLPQYITEDKDILIINEEFK